MSIYMVEWYFYTWEWDQEGLYNQVGSWMPTKDVDGELNYIFIRNGEVLFPYTLIVEF